MLLWRNTYSELENTSQSDENGTYANDCRAKSNLAERLAETTRAALFQFSNKSVGEHNLGRIIFDNGGYTEFVYWAHIIWRKEMINIKQKPCDFL